MRFNQSIPNSTVIPVLAYPNAPQAAAWLCSAFGFTERLRGDIHRVQLNVGDGAIIIREPRPHEVGAQLGLGWSVTIRIADADAHCQHARKHGAHITQEPCDYPYGERQYTAVDFAGYPWTFSQSIADLPPESWGGTSVRL